MQALDSTAKQKIAAEPMGATNIFNFTVKPISYASFRFSIWGLGWIENGGSGFFCNEPDEV